MRNCDKSNIKSIESILKSDAMKQLALDNNVELSVFTEYYGDSIAYTYLYAKSTLGLEDKADFMISLKNTIKDKLNLPMSYVYVDNNTKGLVITYNSDNLEQIKKTGLEEDKLEDNESIAVSDEDMEYFFNEDIPEFESNNMAEYDYSKLENRKTISVKDITDITDYKKKRNKPIYVTNLFRNRYEPGMVVGKIENDKKPVFVKYGSPAYFKHYADLELTKEYKIKNTAYYFLSDNVILENLEDKEKRLLERKQKYQLLKNKEFLITPTPDNKNASKIIKKQLKELEALSQYVDTESINFRHEIVKQRINEREEALDKLTSKQKLPANKEELITELSEFLNIEDKELAVNLMNNLPAELLSKINIRNVSDLEERAFIEIYDTEKPLLSEIDTQLDDPIYNDYMKLRRINSSTNRILHSLINETKYSKPIIKAIEKVNEDTMNNGKFRRHFLKEELEKITAVTRYSSPKIKKYISSLKGVRTKAIAIALEVNDFDKFINNYLRQASVMTIFNSHQLNDKLNKGEEFKKLIEYTDDIKKLNDYIANNNYNIYEVERAGLITLDNKKANSLDLFEEIGHFIYDTTNNNPETINFMEFLNELRKNNSEIDKYYGHIHLRYADIYNNNTAHIASEFFAKTYSAILNQSGELFELINNTEEIKDNKTLYEQILDFINGIIKRILGENTKKLKNIIDKIHEQISQQSLDKIKIDNQIIELQYVKNTIEPFNNEIDEIKQQLIDSNRVEIFNNEVISVKLPNGSDSMLFNELTNYFSNEQAYKIYLTTLTDNFKNFASETSNDFKYDSGEPMLFFHGSSTSFYALDTSKFYSGEGAMAYGAGLYITNEYNTSDSYSSGATNKRGTKKYKDLYKKLFNPRYINKDNNPYIHELFVAPLNPLPLDKQVTDEIKNIFINKLSNQVRFDDNVRMDNAEIRDNIVYINPNSWGSTYYGAMVLWYNNAQYPHSASEYMRVSQYLSSQNNTFVSQDLFNAGIEASYRTAGGASNAFGGNHRRGEMHVISYTSNPIKSINNIGAYNRNNINKYYSLDNNQETETQLKPEYILEDSESIMSFLNIDKPLESDANKKIGYDAVKKVQLTKEQGNTKQLILRYNALIERLQDARNNPNVNKYKIDEQIQKYNEQIALFSEANTNDAKLEIIQNLAEYDLKGSEAAIRKPNLNASQLRNIIVSAEMWSDIRQFVEIPGIPVDIEKLENRAKELRLEAYDKIIQLEIEQTKEGDFKLSEQDMKILKGDGFEMNFLNIANSMNKFVRYINSFLEKQGLKKKKEIGKKVKESNALFDKVDDKKRLKLFKTDENGNPLINHLRYEVSDIHYNEKKEASRNVNLFFKEGVREDLKSLIMQAISGGRAERLVDAKNLLILSSGMDEKYVNELIRAAKEAALDPDNTEPEIVYKALLKATDMAKQDRNQWYKDNVIILSPHAYSREKNPDGTLKVTPEESERLIAEFKEAVKNDHYAESRIKIAKDRIDRYYKDQEDFRMFSEGNFLDDPEGLAEALKQWEYQNSPFLYYDAIHNPGNLSEGESELVNKKMDYDRLPAYAPKKPEHYDEGFKEILADPDLLALYNHLSSYMRQAMEMFPPNASANVGNDFFVRMKSSVWEQFVANGYKPLSGNSFLTDAVALKHNYEFIDQLDELGNPLRKLSYPQLLDVDAEILNYKKLLEEPGLTKEDKKIYENKLKELQREYTLDLKKTMELFIHMVENYKHNAEVVDQAQLQLYLVNQAKEDIGKGGYKTGGLKTTQTVVDYTIGASLFDDFRAEPDQYKKGEFWEDHIFTNLDLTGFSSAKKVKAREIKTKAMKIDDKYQELKVKLEKKEKLTPEEWTIINEYQGYQKEYKDLGGKRFSFTQLIYSFINWTALKTMGLSPISAGTNLNFGVLSNYMEAFAGQFFTVKEAGAAFKEMLATTKNMVSFGKNEKARMSDKRMKIVNFLTENNLIFDIMEVNYGRDSKVNTDFMYTLMRKSDFFMKGQLIIASMMHDKVETKTGPKSLWSLIKTDGTIDSDQILDWNEDKEIKMAQKLLALSKRIHGNTDTSSPVHYKKYVAGNALAQFKFSWMAEGTASRWRKSRPDENLGVRVEGRWRALPRLISDTQLLMRNSGAESFSEKWKFAMNNLDSTDVANIRRIAVDGVLIISLFILYNSLMALKNSLDDDDKYAKLTSTFTLNMLYRLRNDLQFYTSISTIKEITSNPIPSLRIITDLQRAVSSTATIMNPIGDQDMDDVERAGKNWMKAITVTRPIYTTVKSTTDDYEDIVQ